MQIPAELSVPHVWRVTDLAREESVLPSGHAMLDAQLPGGGWPWGGMVEVLQHRPEAHVWQLLLPAIASLVKQREGPLVLVGAPHIPFGPALSAQGLPAERLLCIRTRASAARLWAAEQALGCADVLAVLAWLPQAQARDLRRLHLAARQRRRFLVVIRDRQAVHQASPAPLRVLLEGVDELRVRIVKRKGPGLDAPVVLPAWPERLQALLQSRRRSSLAQPAPTVEKGSHVLDRLVASP